MPATVSQVMTGVKDRLATISGLRAFAFQPDFINPPTAFPTLNEVSYHGSFGGGDVIFDGVVQVIVGGVSDRLTQGLLDGFASYSGASSIRAALEGEPTLGGVAQTLVVNRSVGIRRMAIGDAEFVTVEIAFQVHG